jgi:dihydroxyacetone kinase-like protein
MTATITRERVQGVLLRAAEALQESQGRFTELDQALGDGDLGVTAAKMAEALAAHVQQAEETDLGKYLMAAGMAMNRAAPSTFGTLAATALMRAGREVKGKTELAPADVAAMLLAADSGIQERGKAKPGDKTVIDALHPAAEAFERELQSGADLPTAAKSMLTAAEEGMESVTALRSRTGRAGWIGERTEGKVDPGCYLLVTVMRAVLG